jgi:hypothetical protein
VWRVLHDIRLPMSVSTVRREIDYLRGLGLIEIEGADTETWYAKLTAQGWM